MNNHGVHGSHWLRYGIAGDQEYLLNEFNAGYDQLVLNANIVAHMPAAISTFVSQKANKPYVIDPQTHAFQHEIEYLLSTSKKSAGELKNSWSGLVAAYGSPLDVVIGGETPRPLIPADFKDSGLLREFCERVVAFQYDAIKTQIDSGKDSKYLKFLASKSGAVGSYQKPAIIIAPYFYVGGPAAEEWIRLNIRCVKATLAVCKARKINIPVAAQIVVSKDVLANSAFLDPILTDYKAAGSETFLLWVDNFVEQSASPPLLKRFVDVVAHLSDGGGPVVNLYGGYFSVAQAKVGALQGKLLAVCHGLEYGESKPVVPVSGGIAVAKFYSNNLHARHPARVAYQEISAMDALNSAAKFHQLICGCDECRKHIKGNPRLEFLTYYAKTVSKPVRRNGQWTTMQFPTAETSDHCTRHYMWCKIAEYRDAASRNEVKAQLTAAQHKLEPHLGADYAGHPSGWAKLL